jgi:hypothetical protein
MSTYNITSKLLIDNYAVIQTLENSEIVVGSSIVVAGLGAPFNGTFTVLDLPEHEFIGIDSTTGFPMFNEFVQRENQVLFACTGANVNYTFTTVGTVSYTPVCTWISANDISDWLYVATATAADQAFLTICAAASNQFAFRRRQESGYFDALGTVPSQDVKLGTIMYGGALYRQRGSVDQFSSFNEMGSQPPVALSAMVQQLLGIQRPQVA